MTKTKPSLPEGNTQMQSVLAHSRGWKHQMQSEGWPWIQILFVEKFVNWEPGWYQLTMSFFCSKLSAIHCGCHGNMVWKSASNWYQFLSSPRLTGGQAICSISDTKYWIVKDEQQSIASHVRQHSICAGWMCEEAVRHKANPLHDAVAMLELTLG